MKYTDGVTVHLKDKVIFVQQGTLRLGEVILIGTDAVRLEYSYDDDGVEIVASVTRPVEQIVLIDANLEQIDGMKEAIEAYEKGMVK